MAFPRLSFGKNTAPSRRNFLTLGAIGLGTMMLTGVPQALMATTTRTKLSNI